MWCQAFDSAVLYVDQKVTSSPSSVVGDETRSGPRESTVSETVGESQVVPWTKMWMSTLLEEYFCGKKS